MKSAIYARVSTVDQQTLPMQINAMKDYVNNRKWILVKEVTEIGSGATKRPLREELMRLARQREIDNIIVWKLDRWGRSVPDLISSLNELQEIGVGFVSITEALDLTTSVGRAMAGMLAIFAEFERDILKERIKAGLAQARERGQILGRPKTAIDKSELVIAFKEKGLSNSEVARRLKIDRRSVGRIILNKGALNEKRS